MKDRLNIKELEPGAYKAMLKLEDYLTTTAITPLQHELIRIRASQLNGCAYCINMHTQDARSLGEKEHRIYALSAWRETPFFTEEEKSILEITEEVTFIGQGGVSESTYNKAVASLGEQGVAQVIMAAIVINAWNRIGVSTKMKPVAELV